MNWINIQDKEPEHESVILIKCDSGDGHINYYVVTAYTKYRKTICYQATTENNETTCYVNINPELVLAWTPIQ